MHMDTIVTSIFRLSLPLLLKVACVYCCCCPFAAVIYYIYLFALFKQFSPNQSFAPPSSAALLQITVIGRVVDLLFGFA